MTKYVQWDAIGGQAVIITNAPAPICDNQIIVDDAVSTDSIRISKGEIQQVSKPVSLTPEP